MKNNSKSEHIKIKVEPLKMNVNLGKVTVTTESNYLLYSQREVCKKLFKKETLTEVEILEFLLSLHLILEIGINTLFRNLPASPLSKEIGRHTVMKNIDRVNFIDKVVMFIYYSSFKFDDLDRAIKYHSLIESIKDFAEIRNKILHGYSISSVSGDGKVYESDLKKKLNSLTLQKQIEKFKFITEGLKYYVSSLEHYPNGTGRGSYIKEYLDNSFLS